MARPGSVLRWAVFALGMAIAGCGYTTRGLYPESIETIHVPIFKNQGLRRDIEFILTEKVIQEIEARTPFKVTSSPDADTELLGTVSAFYKSPFGEDPYDNPRGGNMMLTLNVRWIDKRSGEVIAQSERTFTLNTSADYAIDVAQSQASAIDESVRQMADYIVRLLQAPW